VCWLQSCDVHGGGDVVDDQAVHPRDAQQARRSLHVCRSRSAPADSRTHNHQTPALQYDIVLLYHSFICSSSYRPHYRSCLSVRPSVSPSVLFVAYGLLTRKQKSFSGTAVASFSAQIHSSPAFNYLLSYLLTDLLQIESYACGWTWLPLRGESLVWLIGVVVCLLAATAGPIVRWRGQWMAA